MIELYSYQKEAIEKLRTGSILSGGVGSGKSITALAYYFYKVCEGELKKTKRGNYLPYKMNKPRDLYIITTAKKRNSLEWDKECGKFCLVPGNPERSVGNVKVTIDSWNNIKKYTKPYGAFYIFDEQRVVGKGSWVKAFLDITRKNKWILLSATPGDKWEDYIPIFIANGFYRNRTEFYEKHCVFARFAKYPKIERYIYEDVLQEYRNRILVPMEDERMTVRHKEYVKTEYSKDLWRTVIRMRWDPWMNEPIRETGKLCYLMRRVSNEDESRLNAVLRILAIHQKAIIFYNFDYELNLLRDLFKREGILCKEYNGHQHDDLPEGESWVYLVQYLSGSEGWNCITTNCVIYYSLNYSYRTTEQAAGRIDRVNTPYKDLYYYILYSASPMDLAINRALKEKKDFNERKYLYG